MGPAFKLNGVVSDLYSDGFSYDELKNVDRRFSYVKTRGAK